LNDSLSVHFGRISLFVNFINNVAAYETIKSMGFKYISNDSLRIKIGKYNEYECEYYQE